MGRDLFTRARGTFGSFLTLASLGALPALSGCGETPVDAILTRSDSVGDCALSSSGIERGVRFRLRSVASGRCLSAGQPILVMGTPALVTMVDDCSRADVWQIEPAISFGAFEVFDTRVQRNLDIEISATADGTRAILYLPNGFRHQQFIFSERRERVFQLAPVHVATSCLADLDPSPQIFACTPEAVEQEWQLLSETCL
jgi:hypothetical protein